MTSTTEDVLDCAPQEIQSSSDDFSDKALDYMFVEAQKHAHAHKLRSLDMEQVTAFERNLEEILNQRRASQNFATLHQWHHAIDFSSNDFLSLTSTGLLRAEFLEELKRNPSFRLGSTGSRLLDGNNPYCEDLEKDIASFHGAQTALMVNSGCKYRRV